MAKVSGRRVTIRGAPAPTRRRVKKGYHIWAVLARTLDGASDKLRRHLEATPEKIRSRSFHTRLGPIDKASVTMSDGGLSCPLPETKYTLTDGFGVEPYGTGRKSFMGAAGAGWYHFWVESPQKGSLLNRPKSDTQIWAVRSPSYPEAITRLRAHMGATTDRLFWSACDDFEGEPRPRSDAAYLVTESWHGSSAYGHTAGPDLTSWYHFNVEAARESRQHGVVVHEPHASKAAAMIEVSSADSATIIRVADIATMVFLSGVRRTDDISTKAKPGWPRRLKNWFHEGFDLWLRSAGHGGFGRLDCAAPAQSTMAIVRWPSIKIVMKNGNQMSHDSWSDAGIPSEKFEGVCREWHARYLAWSELLAPGAAASNRAQPYIDFKTE